MTDQRALSARYDHEAGQFVLVMDSGIEVRFRPSDVEGMQGAAPEDLERVELSPRGLHWDALDVDLTVDGILQGRLGRRAWEEARRRPSPP